MVQLGIVGCGAWATAIAKGCADNGHQVTMLCHRAEYVDAINQHHENTYRLAGISLPESIVATTDVQALANQEACIIGVPSAHVSGLDYLKGVVDNQPMLSVVKGMTPEGHLATDVIASLWKGRDIAVLSGPNLALEIAKGQPAATVVASGDVSQSTYFQELLSSSLFRVYTSSDVKGVSLGGTLKNGMAIAAGIIDGRSLGENAKSALLTRALQEMVRLGEHLGGHASTFYGLSGLGDLMATAHSDKSRNWRLGYALGQGQSLDQAKASIGGVTEGVEATRQAVATAKSVGIELPILEQVDAVLSGSVDITQAVSSLMNRKLRAE